MYHQLLATTNNYSPASNYVPPNTIVADPGQGPGPPGPPFLFLGQTEAQRAEKNFFETAPPPPPDLKVWIYDCSSKYSE